MLLDRKEMSFDFGGAKFDPVRDQALLGWMMNQFLYGEVTGIQCGHWLYEAPTIEAARFLARQATEEFQHIDNFLRILAEIGVPPGPPHPVVRFLATGMMGHSWAEHVSLEMATGEGFVLMAFYGLIDTIDHPAIVEILNRAVKQEERHVEFGEQETRKTIEAQPRLAERLLGLHLVWMWGVRRLAAFMQKRLADHPVLRQLPAFLERSLFAAELRMMRMGILARPLSTLSPVERGRLIAGAYAHRALSSAADLLRRPLALVPGRGRKRLTDVYLDDPVIRSANPPKP